MQKMEKKRDFLAALKDGLWYDSRSKSGLPDSVHMKSARSLSLFWVLSDGLGTTGAREPKKNAKK
jgi:hypothetical protein